MKKIAILGSTGSIGTQTLDVVREHSDELQVVALAAGSNKERLKEQIKHFFYGASNTIFTGTSPIITTTKIAYS